MRTHYELLSVDPGALPEDIKRAFRREIARYHPDKVQHLGAEFQQIAAARAAELTEAYRVLMDPESRERYDGRLADGTFQASPAAAPQPSVASPQSPEPPPAHASPSPAADRRFEHERSTTGDFVRKAVFAKLREAVGAVAAGTTAAAAPGVDAAYSLKGKGGLFRKSEPPVRLLAKYVPQVDAASIEQAWPAAVSAAQDGETVCLVMLGGGVAPARELSAAVSHLRRRGRNAAPVVVAVDVRDWEALFPPEAPQSVRAIVQRLREGNGF